MAEGYYTSPESEIIQNNRQIILDGIFGSNNPIQVGSSMAFAKYLSHVGITSKNYYLFLKLIETNNRWIVDELLADRDPRLLFTTIRPNLQLITRAFVLLSAWHPGQIYEKVILSVLGIIEYSYYKPDDGYDIYAISITDLQNMGKFLNTERDQFDNINETLLEILDRIARLGEYHQTQHKLTISKQAFNIRDAYFDNTKQLTDTIPKVLMVRIMREDREVKPSPEFIDFARKISET